MKIIDSIGHPTVAGSWLGRGSGFTFSKYLDDLKKSNFAGACVVGLAGTDGYSHKAFSEQFSAHPEIYPVAGLDPFVDNLSQELEEIKAFGFRAVKIHPRFSCLNFTTDHSRLVNIFNHCSQLDLTVFLCTFLHGPVAQNHTSDPQLALSKVLQNSPNVKVVLLHGGDVQLMSYSELVRYNENLILDLSFTILRYHGSSLDLDIKYLCRTLDRRICIGTDWPEYKPEELRNKFESLVDGLPIEKINNIAFKNLSNFLNWDLKI